jgi:hypothetical protein
MTRPDIYFSIDIEADGPIPGPYSLLSVGIAVAGVFDGNRFERREPSESTFYAELQPISTEYVQEALDVSGLDRERLTRSGLPPADAMNALVSWVRQISRDRRPVLVAYPSSFDWMFLYWYLVKFAERGSPFGFSSVLDMKTMYATKARVPLSEAKKKQMPSALLSRRVHTHHALDDAIEQAEMFANLFTWQPRVHDEGGRTLDP